MEYAQNESHRKSTIARNCYLAWALASAFLVASLFIAALAFHHKGDVTHAIRVGKMFYDKPGVADLVRKSDPLIYQDIGFDGQFFYFLAHDPLLKKEATVNGLDAPHLRARRIMYPLLSRMLVSTNSRIPKGMVLAVLLSYLGIAIVTASLLRRRDFSPLWVFSAVMSLSVAVSSEYFTGETLAIAFIFLAFWGYMNKKRWVTWIATAAAILTKEPAAALTLALVIIQLKERKWRDALFYFTTVLPFIVWLFYLKIHLPVESQPLGMLKNFTAPFWGALRLFPSEVHQILRSENERVYRLRIFSQIWFLVAAITVIVIVVRHRTAVSVFALLGALNAIFLSSGKEAPCYDYLTHFARQLFIFPPAVFLLFLETRNKILKWLLIILVVLTLSAYYLLIKGKFI